MKFASLSAALVVALSAGSPAWATNHLDFQRQQCNGDAADLDAQIAACARIVASDRFSDKAKGVAYYNMGVAYGANGQLAQAVENYDKAIELNPDDADAAFNRDIALRMLKEPGQKVADQPRGKNEITRRDLPEDMRKNTSAVPVERTKQDREMQTDRTVKQRTKAPRTKMERKKIR